MIKQKPYKLVNYIQNYEWGTKGKDAFIPKLLGFEAEEKPYAEVWIGSHPKLSSEILIDGKASNLETIIEKCPKEILGEKVAKKFGNKLPFLLKILSANQALSIQTHPNKTQAIDLYKNDPNNYPDYNHKPEIAIALDFLKALVGFRPLNEIEANFLLYQQLINFVGSEKFSEFTKDKSQNGLKKLFTALMKKSLEVNELRNAILSIKDQIEQKSKQSEDEELFIILFQQYGIDIGLFVLFFLNVVNLKSGEAIYTPAGIPHAYLKGNIVECMANSDNVVRAGLTPKFKDIDQLANILTYQFGKPELIGKIYDSNITEYKVSAEEFCVEKIVLDNTDLDFSTNNKVEIIFVTEGEITCDKLQIKKGESVLIPALLTHYSIISITNSTLFRVTVSD
ncbi:MAG: mannose-6-phosphate isomerase, class I [Ignavibacteriales bacterium CG18_big_fil_WC_8_21_14_2_50_31_20]|nr:MAG: mannose-6-phosphate isomerase, class I [Ignavibacteriales bacterium CG18_big_fil_WC_8_21_14_2_50_31_20]